MYCVIETQFYCDGGAKTSAAKFNAMFEDLKALLDRHPGVTCTMFDEEDWPLAPEELREHAETEAELDTLTDGNGQ